MNLRLLLRCCVTLLLLGPAAASQAQDTRQLTAAASLRRVASNCRAETQRLCPALAGRTPMPREQAICLRPYKTSLSLGCRGAVTAATHAGE